jgi:hypothetical protein
VTRVYSCGGDIGDDDHSYHCVHSYIHSCVEM